MKKILSLPAEVYQNRKMIFKLAKNDFKTKFAGSYLGIVWAFIQPVVTVMVYWFVFEVGFRAGDNSLPVPFVLYLVAGIVPWFFFQEALTGGTNALIEYKYLVQKVVFNVSVLPIVKMISALFVHTVFVCFVVFLYCVYGKFPDLYYLQIFYYSGGLFVLPIVKMISALFVHTVFVCFVVFLYCVYGKFPDLYYLQIFYYSGGLLLLTLGICYTTSAVVVFFRDLSQMINIALQVGVWLTPIMWIADDVLASHKTLLTILKLNPIYYIVSGYRDAFIYKNWFWERPLWTLYFWGFTIAVFLFGNWVFKRLRVHFADVL